MLPAVLVDVTDREFTLPSAEVVLLAIGYDRYATPSQREVYVEGLRAVLDRMPSPPERIVYVSSTGVYGQADGSWVNEDSPCEPTRAGGKICLEAERLLQSHQFGRRSVILRLAGIYGPGRVPYVKRLRAYEPLAVPRSGYLNLIHVDDAADAVVTVASARSPRPLYVVSDGRPVRRGEWYATLARLIASPPPAWDPTAPRTRGADKRVDSALLRSDLGFRPRHPDALVAIAELLAAQ